MTQQRKENFPYKRILFSVLFFALLFYGLDRAAKMVVEHYQIPVEGRNVLPGTVIHNSRHSFVEPDPTRIWKLRPGTKNYGRDIFINSDGFRGEELLPDSAGRKRLIMIGDSCVFGWGVGHGETIAARLSDDFSENGHDVEVINAGVPGYSSLQALNHLKEILKTHRPDIVTIQIGWNDSWPTPSMTDRDIISRGTWLISFNYFVRKLWVVRLASYAISKRYYEKFEIANTPGDLRRRVPLAEFRANLIEMIRLSRENNALPVLVTLPQRMPLRKLAIANYLALLPEIADATGVQLIDLVPPIQSEREENGHLFVDDIHFSAEGSKVVAKIIATRLRQSAAFPRNTSLYLPPRDQPSNASSSGT